MLQVLSSIQYICFRKTSISNMGSPNLLLAPGAIWPRYAPGHVSLDKWSLQASDETLQLAAKFMHLEIVFMNNGKQTIWHLDRENKRSIVYTSMFYRAKPKILGTAKFSVFKPMFASFLASCHEYCAMIITDRRCKECSCEICEELSVAPFRLRTPRHPRFEGSAMWSERPDKRWPSKFYHGKTPQKN